MKLISEILGGLCEEHGLWLWDAHTCWAYERNHPADERCEVVLNDVMTKQIGARWVCDVILDSNLGLLTVVRHREDARVFNMADVDCFDKVRDTVVALYASHRSKAI